MTQRFPISRRTFLSSCTGVLGSYFLSETVSSSQSSDESYPIGFPLEQLWETGFSVEDRVFDSSIFPAGVDQDTVYIIVSHDQNSKIVAVSRSDGVIKWEFSYDSELISATGYGDYLFACGIQQFLAFDITSAPSQPVWEVEVPNEFAWDVSAGDDTVWFVDYSVREIEGDQTLEISSGGLHAYSQSGTHRWSRDVGFGGTRYHDGLLLGTNETHRKEQGADAYNPVSGRVEVRDANTGEVKWHSPEHGIDRIHPAFHQDILIGVATDGTIYGYDLESGVEQWRHLARDQPSDITSDASLIFYAVNQTLTAYDPSTESKVWELPTPPIYDLTYDQQLLYIGDEEGHFQAVDAETGDSVWDYSLDGSGVGYEWIVDGTLYCVSGRRMAVFEGRQGKALHQLWDLQDRDTPGTHIANLAGMDNSLETAEQAIENHNYENAMNALDRARLLQQAGDSVLWAGGLVGGYITSRRGSHEIKRKQFESLVKELLSAYPINEGALRGASPESLFDAATAATRTMETKGLGRPVTAGWLNDDEYTSLKDSISTAIDLEPRLRKASIDLQEFDANLQAEWKEALIDALESQQFSRLKSNLDQFETATELQSLHDSLERSDAQLNHSQLSALIDELLSPDSEFSETDTAYCEAATTAITSYQGAKSTLTKYDLGPVVEKLNESLDVVPSKRNAATRNFKRIQKLINKATTVESQLDNLDLRFINLSMKELEAQLQQCLRELAIDQLDELADLVDNLATGTWQHQDLYQFSATGFERMVAELYEAQGYETAVSQASNDKGVDVIARGQNEIIAIQVKQYSRGNKVGRPTVQQLAGAREQVGATKGVVLTSSSFTDTAISASRSYGQRLELIDGDQLVGLLTRSSISPPRHGHSAQSERSGSSSGKRSSRNQRQTHGGFKDGGGGSTSGRGRERGSVGDNGSFGTQYCMMCGQEYRGDLREVLDPSGRTVYVCARCEQLLKQSDANQRAEKMNAYEVLGLSPDSSQQEIEAAYRKKARATHPDAGGSKDEFMEVQQAYEILTADS